MNSKSKRYTLSEVIEFLEFSIREEMATQQEEDLYISYKWNNEYIDTKQHLHTIKKIIRKMKRYYAS